MKISHCEYDQDNGGHLAQPRIRAGRAKARPSISTLGVTDGSRSSMRSSDLLHQPER
jgi:hypothetical protein